MNDDNFNSEQNTEGNSYYQQNGYAQQGSYQQEGYSYYQQVYEEPKKESQAFGIASMVIGIISLVLFCSCINIPLAVVAIIFGIIQLVKPGSKKGMAIAGVITSALSIILFVIMIIACLLSTDFREGFEQGFENGLGDDFYKYNITEFYDNGDGDTF